MFLWEDSVQDERQVLKEELAKIRNQVAKLETALEEKPDYGLRM
jgi:hypothetical protein